MLFAIELRLVDKVLHHCLLWVFLITLGKLLAWTLLPDLTKSSKKIFTVILIIVCHLTKMAHFVPCHKEITTEDTVDLFIDNCYKLHGVPKVIVSDRVSRFVGTFWQSFTRKLNTKLNTSTARHPQIGGLIERVNETMQILLRCYTTKSRFDLVFHLPMVELYYNCSINESSKHPPFQVSYGFQPATPTNRLLPLTGAPALVADRLTELANVREVV
jgi:transposase InsO family protein